MKYKLILFTFAFILVLSMYSVSAVDLSNLNNSCQNLANAVGNDCSANYNLMENLNCTGQTIAPICSSGYSGVFNGKGHTITGLTIDNTAGGSNGLFAIFTGATVENLGVVGINDTGSGGNTGGLVAYATTGSLINNSYVTGNVFGGNVYQVGGLVAYLDYGTIINSYFSGNVTSYPSTTYYEGGLVGYTADSSIINSYSSGNVTGSYSAGGLVGNAASNVDINNSFSTSYVSANGPQTAGALVGFAGGGFVINNSYWINYGQGYYCYYFMGSDGCKNVTDISYFYSIGNRPMNSWDFNNVWSIAYNRTGFPPLLMQGIPIPPPPTPQQNLCSSWFNGMSNFNSIIYLIIGFFVVLIVLGITSLIVMIVKNEGMVDSGDSGLSGVLNFKVVAGALVGLVIVVMVLTIMIASMCGIV